MSKRYSVHIDITYSGYVEIEASSQANAEALAKQIRELPFGSYHVATDVVEGDTEEVDTCSKCGESITRAIRTDDEGNLLCEDCFIEGITASRSSY